jgi:hypothetical protein
MVRAAPSRFIRRCCIIEINPETYGGRNDTVAFYYASGASEAIQSLDGFTASASRVDLRGTRCTSQRYQEVGMTGSRYGSPVEQITILYVRKLWILDQVFGLSTTDPSLASGRLPRIL